MLVSHLLRAALFGALAGWLGSLLAGVVEGWLLYLGCLALAAAGGWVLVRPMDRNTLLAAAALWAAAVCVYCLLRPPGEIGLLASNLAGYVVLATVVASFGFGALLGRALARP